MVEEMIISGNSHSGLSITLDTGSMPLNFKNLIPYHSHAELFTRFYANVDYGDFLLTKYS